MEKTTVAILGAGSFGTAVAIHLASAGIPVLLWGHDAAHVDAMLVEHQNRRYLPDISFPPGLLPTASLAICLAKATQVIIALPSHAFGDLLLKLEKPASGLTWLTKGVDPNSHRLLSQLVAKKWGNDYPVGVVSGPSFAREMAELLPTAVVLAGNDEAYLTKIHAILHQGNLRVYLTDDVIGVQLGGAIKNIIAIACGISDGLNFGANAKAALITRGLAEMTRLGVCLGARLETFMGLAGIGDLVLTCTDNQSRNRRFGIQIGQGIGLDVAERHIGQVVEGIHTAAQICALATKYKVEMPICEAVNAVLLRKINANDAVEQLMSRPPKEE